MAELSSIHYAMWPNDVPYDVRHLLTDEGQHKYRQLIEAGYTHEGVLKPDITVAARMNSVGTVEAEEFVAMGFAHSVYKLRACRLRCGIWIVKIYFEPGVQVKYYAFDQYGRPMVPIELHRYWTQEVEPLMALCRLSR